MSWQAIVSDTFLFILLFGSFRYLEDLIKELQSTRDIFNTDNRALHIENDNQSMQLNEHKFKIQKLETTISSHKSQIHKQRQRIASLEKGKKK